MSKVSEATSKCNMPKRLIPRTSINDGVGSIKVGSIDICSDVSDDGPDKVLEGEIFCVDLFVCICRYVCYGLEEMSQILSLYDALVNFK